MKPAAHMIAKRLCRPLCLLLGLCLIGSARAERITLAVAANFQEPMRELAARFQANSGHEVVLVFGSTGKHYAQIKHGAPFDALFAADIDRPARLEREGAAVAGSRFTYARGVLALWSPRAAEPEALLRSGRFDRLAIANPRLSPYGEAAAKTLERLGLWQAVQPKLVRGEDITQTYHFVATGNAQLGFVALSQLAPSAESVSGAYWLVPPALHPPLDQQAVLLRAGEAVQEFLGFVRSEPAREIIRRYGYQLPEGETAHALQPLQQPPTR